VALAAFLAGQRHRFRAAWRRLRLPAGSIRSSDAVRWLRANVVALQLGGLAQVVVVLLFADLTWGQLLLFMLLVGAYESALLLIQRRAVAGT
jgi:hypothetical protein